jgi:hypothetical protein
VRKGLHDKKNNKKCDNCLTIIDSIGLQLKSLELVEDSLSKLAEKAIKTKGRLIKVDDIYLEIISTALYNSINDIKKIIDR